MSDKVFKVFDKLNNGENTTDEYQALQLLSQLPSDQVATLKDDKKWTLVHHACFNGWYVAVKVLIDDYMCDVNAKNNDGSGPLTLACCGGSLKLVKYLVYEKKCDPLQPNDSGSIPLHSASLRGYIDIVRFLVREQNSDPSYRNSDEWTPLHLACQNGHLDVAKFLILEQKCDPSCKKKNGWTPLHSACSNGHLDMAKCLIHEQNCNPSCKRDDGWTPLHSACENGYFDVAKFLIEQKCDVSLKDSDGWTPLHVACANGHLNLAKFLIFEKKCDLFCKKNDGSSPLHLACENGHLDLVKFLILEQKCDPSHKDNDGCTPLHLACKNGHLHLAEFLVLFEQKKCNLLDKQCSTPLHLACKNGHLDIARFLILDQKYDPSSMNNYAWTPLHYACQNGHIDVIQFLLFEQNCDSLYEHKGQLSPLHIASINGYIEVFKLFLLKGCNPSCQDNLGQTPLHLACENGHLDMAKFLVLEQKCDPSHKDNIGWTSLHFACGSGHIQLAKFLLKDLQCDPSCTTKSGNTPLHLACHNGHLEVVMLLIFDYNSNPSCKNKYGQTPLHLASNTGLLNIAVFLVLNQKCDPLCEDKGGWSPLRLAFQNGFIDIVRLFLTASQVNNVYSSLPSAHHDIFRALQLHKDQYQLNFKHFPSLKVFIVGDMGVGKSTLAKAINLKFSKKKSLLSRRVSGVKSPTAGIDTIHFQDTKSSHIILYDFAGQREYYSSHGATLKTVSSSEGSVVLVVVDLSKSKEEIAKNLLYWNLFLKNIFPEDSLNKSAEYKTKQSQLSPITEPASITPPLYVVGSHADVLKHTGANPTETLHSVLEKLPVVPKRFTKELSVVLNCTKLSSHGLSSLCDVISKHSTLFQEQLKLKVDVQLHFLSSLIKQSFSNQVACQLQGIATLINADDNFAFRCNSLLPTDIRILSQLLETLCQNGEFIYLKNNSDLTTSWVIIDKAVLLSEVNGTIFAPKDFMQHPAIISNSNGVVPLEKIQKVFPKYDAVMIMDFLLHLEFCRKIGVNDIFKSSYHSNTQDSTSADSFYFFPALVRSDRPASVNNQSLIHGTNSSKKCVYLSGWCLQCLNDEDFFTSHFWHILLLRLSFQFAPPPDVGQENEDIPTIQRECIIWRTGIQWYLDGVETIVEFVEQNKAVVIRVGCSQGKEMKCVRHRSKLIQSVLQIKDEILSSVRVQEYIIHPKELQKFESEVTVKSLHSFSLNKLAVIVLEQDDIVTSQRGTDYEEASIEELLYFEPYRCMCFIQGDSELFSHECCELPLAAEFLKKVESGIVTASSYANRFQDMLIYEFKCSNNGKAITAVKQANESGGSPSHRCSQMVLCWAKHTPKPTYGALRLLLDRYSIFCGKDPLVLAGRERVSSLPSSISIHTNQASCIPDQSAVYKLLLPMSSEWQNIATLLGVPNGRIKAIEYDNRKADNCLRAMLAEWLQHYDLSPSWHALAEAVESLGNEEVAQTIRDQ